MRGTTTVTGIVTTAGTLELNGPNTLGGLVISGGAFGVSGTTSIGGSVTFPSGIYELNGQVTVEDDVTVSLGATLTHAVLSLTTYTLELVVGGNLVVDGEINVDQRSSYQVDSPRGVGNGARFPSHGGAATTDASDTNTNQVYGSWSEVATLGQQRNGAVDDSAYGQYASSIDRVQIIF
jgi:hypothetical protein